MLSPVLIALIYAILHIGVAVNPERRFAEYGVNVGELFAFLKCNGPNGKENYVDPRQSVSLDQAVLFHLGKKHGLNLSLVDRKTTWEKLSDKLRKLHYEYKGKNGGRGRQNLERKWKRQNFSVKVFFSDFLSIEQNLARELEKENQRNQELTQRLHAAQVKCSRVKSLERQVHSLSRKLAGIQKRGPSRLHMLAGKTYSARQKTRRRAVFFQDVKRALQLIGIPECEITHVEIRNQCGKVQKIKISGGDDTDTITDEDVASINMVAYLKEKHLISDDAYHDLAMIFKGLPRSYKVRERMEKLNDLFDIKPVPGKFAGVQQSIFSTLSHRIEFDMQNNDCVFDDDTIRVKISGDGTRVGKRCHVLTFGYSIMCKSQRQSAVNLLAIIKGPESYETWKASLQDVITELSGISTIDACGRSLKIEFYLSGDLKFLNCVTGIDSCNCNYSCVWCKCPKRQRHLMDLEWSAFSASGRCRTIDDIRRCSAETVTARKFNCAHEPLFPFIPISRVIPDTLHMLLRISDRVFGKLVEELRTLDNIAGGNRTLPPENGHVATFEKFVKELGFHFDFFVSDDGKLAFTDLPGPQRLELLEKTSLSTFIPDHPQLDKFEFVWSEFLCLYRLTQKASSTGDAAELKSRAKKWVTSYATEIFLAKDITPYMHLLVYHMPEFITKYGPITPFAQQRFELLNHHLTRLYFRGSNHKPGTALADVMRRHNRMTKLELTPGVRRTPHFYSCSVCRSPDHRRPQCPKRPRIALSVIN